MVSMVSMGMGVDLFREDVEGTIGEANLNIGGMCILFLGISHLHQNVAYEGACRGLDVHVGGEMVINSLVGIGIRSDDLTDAFVEEETNERLPYIPNALKCDRSFFLIIRPPPRVENPLWLGSWRRRAARVPFKPSSKPAWSQAASIPQTIPIAVGTLGLPLPPRLGLMQVVNRVFEKTYGRKGSVRVGIRIEVG